MKILSVYIKNFQGLSELEVDTDAKIIVVKGSNGAGKTSFISAIEWCLCSVPRIRTTLNAKETTVRLKIEKDNQIYELETTKFCENDKTFMHFFITKNNTKTEVKFNDYSNFIEETFIKNPYFYMNFIDSLYYGTKKGIGLTLSHENIKQINNFAQRLGFPIPGRRLVFSGNLDCDIYINSHKLSGGYYSSGDNVLRMTTAKIIAVKFIEELLQNSTAQKNVLPLFIDDVFLMVSNEYVFYVCEYLQKLGNQIFVTNNNSQLSFTNKSVKYLDLDNLNKS